MTLTTWPFAFTCQRAARQSHAPQQQALQCMQGWRGATGLTHVNPNATCRDLGQFVQMVRLTRPRTYLHRFSNNHMLCMVCCTSTLLACWTVLPNRRVGAFEWPVNNLVSHDACRSRWFNRKAYQRMLDVSQNSLHGAR